VLARLAAPQVFGVFAAGSLIVGTGTILVESGMLAAVIHRRDRLEETLHTAFVATVLGGVGLTALALAASPLVGALFSSRQIGLVAAAMSGTLFLTAGTVVPDAILQRRFSFLRRVVVDPLGVIAFGIVGIATLAAGLGVWGLVAASYASQLTQIVAAWGASGFRPDVRRASFGLWRELAGYGRHVLAGAFIDHVSLAVNTFLLGRFVNTGALGQYRYAARFAILPHELAVTAGSYVLFPAFARIAVERERLERAFRRSLRWMLTGVVPVSLLLLPLGQPLVVLLLGERWRPAGVTLAILCLASGPRVLGSVSGESLKAAGRPDVLPPLHLLEAVLSIGLMVALLPLGLGGIAAGVVTASIVADATALVTATRVQRFHAKAIAAIVWPPYVSGAIMVGVVLALDRIVLHAERHGIVAGLAIVSAEALAGLAVYLTCLVTLSPPTASALADGVRTLRARRRRRAEPSTSSGYGG
jgi:O-antigen/teichoic acid export membrane protein